MVGERIRKNRKNQSDNILVLYFNELLNKNTLFYIIFKVLIIVEKGNLVEN